MTIRPVGAGASVRLTGTATTSSAFNVQSTVMRLVAKGASAHVAIGTEPIATNASFFILGGEEEQIALQKVLKQSLVLQLELQQFLKLQKEHKCHS